MRRSIADITRQELCYHAFHRRAPLTPSIGRSLYSESCRNPGLLKSASAQGALTLSSCASLSSHVFFAQPSVVATSGSQPRVNYSSSASRKGFKRRRVVSSFLCAGDPYTTDFRIALFRRSSKVRVYAGKWAACSGSVEDSDASPAMAAQRELNEETGLIAEELEIIGKKPGTGPEVQAAAAARDREPPSEPESDGGIQGEQVGYSGAPANQQGMNTRSEHGRDVHYEIVDEKLGMVWEIWPFLWKVVRRERSTSSEDADAVIEASRALSAEDILSKIVLDWEHEEVRFVTLEEMEHMDTVDNLSRGVREVLTSLDA